jgi:hypothetical protein
MRATAIGHVYVIGEKVIVNPAAGSNAKTNEAFTVRAQLPPLGDVFQYRVKCDSEPYERVVSEAQIERISARIRSSAGEYDR